MFDRIAPAELRAQLGTLGLEAAHPELARDYQAFYGLDLSHRTGLHSRLGRFEAAGFELVAQAWWPDSPRGTLVVLHGYYDHMGLYRHAVDWGLSHGFAVISCDLPGHGLSSGSPASIARFDDYQTVLAGLLGQVAALDLPTPLHLLGQSTGGAIIIERLLLGAPVPGLGRVLLLAPLVRPRAWGWSRLSYEALRHFVSEIPRRFSENSGDAEFLRFLQTHDHLQPKVLPTAWVGALARWIPRIEAAPASPLQPVIVQGEADMTVAWPHNLSVLAAKFQAPEVLRLPQARHHLVNETEALRRQFFGYLSDRLG